MFQIMVITVGEAAKSKTARAMGNAIKEQVIEQGLNFAVDAVRGKDKIKGEKRSSEMGMLKVMM